jgi:hypothetical protein
MSLLSFSAIAQTNYQYTSTHNDTLPEEFKVSASKLRSHIYEGVPDVYKRPSKQRGLFNYADRNAYWISSKISRGGVYSDWPSLEAYINKVLYKITPKELRKDSVIHAYVTKEGGLNASMTTTGISFVQIGLLTYTDNEAALAATLAHELAHYYRKHSLKKYVKDDAGDFYMNRRRSMDRFTIGNERQADSLSLVWLRDAGYNLKGALKGFETIHQEEERLIMRMPKKWELEETTHPLSDERLEQVHSFIKLNKNHAGKDFLVSEADFYGFKNAAREEILKHLMYDFKYHDCLELAFKFHLMDPGNLTYIEYILESIRKNCYQDAFLWGENFITRRYFKSYDNDGKRYKEPWPDHLFAEKNYTMLHISKEEEKRIKANFYWTVEEPKFKTYEEAFVFFYTIARKMKSSEALLSNALSVTLDTNIRNVLLREYLKCPNIKYRDYAFHLLSGDLVEALPKKKLLVLRNPAIYLRQGDHFIPIRAKNEADTMAIRSLMDNVLMEFPDRRGLYISDLNNYNLTEYQTFENLNDFSNFSSISKGEKLEFHILEPRFWALFNKYEVSEIEFLNYTFMETRKSEKTISSYNEILSSTDINELFSHSKRIRDLFASVVSVRLGENKVMKLSYYDEIDFRFRKPTRPQLESLLEELLVHKEEHAAYADQVYRNNLMDKK